MSSSITPGLYLTGSFLYFIPTEYCFATMVKNITLFCFASLLGMIILEVFLRYRGTYDTFGERTGISGYTSIYNTGSASHRPWYFVHDAPVYWKEKEFVHSWNPNNEGLNDHNFSTKKSKPRIMILGDSFVQGVGATSDSTLPLQVGYILADKQPEMPMEVWNCGMAGADPIYEYRLFHDILLKYRPDMLVVVVNSSDVDDVLIRGGFERFRPDSTVAYHHAPWFEPIYAQSHLARFIFRNVFRYNSRLISESKMESAEHTADTILASALDSFSTLCTERQIKLCIAFHPLGYEPPHSSAYRVSPLVDHCKAQHIPYLDMSLALQEDGYDEAHVKALSWPIDSHFKNAGYHYLAELISQQIAAMMDSTNEAKAMIPSK